MPKSDTSSRLNYKLVVKLILMWLGFSDSKVKANEWINLTDTKPSPCYCIMKIFLRLFSSVLLVAKVDLHPKFSFVLRPFRFTNNSFIA